MGTWWVCSAHVVGIQWACGGHVVGMQWVCGGHAVGMWCASSVSVVGMQWVCGGHVVDVVSMQGHAVGCGEHVVGIQWACSGHVLSSLASAREAAGDRTGIILLHSFPKHSVCLTLLVQSWHGDNLSFYISLVLQRNSLLGGNSRKIWARIHF